MAGATEWEDALIKHGIIQAPEKKPTEDDYTLERFHEQEEKRRKAKDTVLDDKTQEEADALEDDVEEDVMAAYRKKRLAELKAQAARNKFGDLRQITEPEFVEQVNKAGKDVWVVLHLFVHGKPECMLMNQKLSIMAKKFKDVKFLKIVSKECIHNYPDHNCPTVLVYKNGEMVKNIVGSAFFGGRRMTDQSVEFALSTIGVVETEIEEDPRIAIANAINIKKAGGRKAGYSSDDDDLDSDDDA